jgi:lysophospholipase L1-like esterase
MEENTMKCRKHLSQVIGMFLITLLMVACSTPQPSPTVTQAPAQSEEMSEWDYVAIGDSMVRGMMYHYVEFVEQDLGVKIELHEWSVSGDTSSSLLERLRSNEQLRQDLQEAEVITFLIPMGSLEIPVHTFESGNPGDCGGADNQDCLREAFETYMLDTDDIIAEIVSIRSPSDTLIRAQDMFQPCVKESLASGTFEIINGYMRMANEHVTEVATKYDIPVARVYNAFMGEDSVEDPRDKGLMMGDGIHPNQEGAILIAELLRELGYEHAPYAP